MEKTKILVTVPVMLKGQVKEISTQRYESMSEIVRKALRDYVDSNSIYLD